MKATAPYLEPGKIGSLTGFAAVLVITRLARE